MTTLPPRLDESEPPCSLNSALDAAFAQLTYAERILYQSAVANLRERLTQERVVPRVIIHGRTVTAGVHHNDPEYAAQRLVIIAKLLNRRQEETP